MVWAPSYWRLVETQQDIKNILRLVRIAIQTVYEHKPAIIIYKTNPARVISQEYSIGRGHYAVRHIIPKEAHNTECNKIAVICDCNV